MKKLFLLIFIFSFLFIINCSKKSTDPNSEGKGIISGKITNPISDLAIPDVNVFTEPPTVSALSDSAGNYSIDDIEPGTYKIIAVKSGYDTNYVNVTVSSDNTTTANLFLTLLAGFITGQISDSFLGAPVFGVKVTLQPEIDSVLSDENGNYIIENVPQGDYVVTMAKIGYNTTNVNVTVNDENGVTADAILPIARVLVAVGNSLTAGFQSGGMHENFQQCSFPNLIAQQMGITYGFEQPIVSAPGIGSIPGRTPFYLDGQGNIVSDNLVVNPVTLLENLNLPRPYDNLGIPGAFMHDMLYATSSTTVQYGENPFFEIILRNPNLGNTTQLEQAIALNPNIITLWIGNNDVLSSMVNGTDQFITAISVFQSDLSAIISNIASETSAEIIFANIPYVTDIPYCNTGRMVFSTVPALGINTEVPVVFDSNFQPVDFDASEGVLYIPLITEETSVEHLLLSGISAYQSGLGVPDSAYLYDHYFVAMGEEVGTAQARAIESVMQGGGLITTGLPLTAEYTLAETETTNLNNAVDSYNAIIESIASSNGIPLVDANSLLSELYTTGMDGYSGRFLPVAAAMGMPTAFSLDGIHPSNGGYAIIANAFIEKINSATGSSIPLINTSQYASQYASGATVKLSMEYIKQIQGIFGSQ